MVFFVVSELCKSVRLPKQSEFEDILAASRKDSG